MLLAPAYLLGSLSMFIIQTKHFFFGCPALLELQPPFPALSTKTPEPVQEGCQDVNVNKPHYRSNQPSDMNVFFPFSHIQINMSENNGEEGTSDPSQEVRDLQTSLDQLWHENEDLRTAATAAKSAELFFSRLSQGIDKVIKKYKPSATVTADKNNDTDENNKDNESCDNDSNDNNNKI